MARGYLQFLMKVIAIFLQCAHFINHKTSFDKIPDNNLNDYIINLFKAEHALKQRLQRMLSGNFVYVDTPVSIL